MPDYFRPLAPRPSGLVVPVLVDRGGRGGPTPGQARGPHLRRTSPGRYVPAATPLTVEQHLLEQAQRLPPGGAVGGWGSLRLHGAAYFDGTSPTGARLPVPLVLPPGRTLHPDPVVRPVRPATCPEVVLRHGIACLEPHDALLWEVARAVDDVAALVMVDMALAAGVVRLERMRSLDRPRRNAGRVVRALRAADERSLSPRESWLRWVWTEAAGLRRPRCNWEVVGPDGRVVAVPDLLDPESGLAADYDGSAHRGARRHRRDEERKEALRVLGIEHVTVVGQGPGDELRVGRRLRAAYERASGNHEPRVWWARPGRLPSW